MHHPPSTQIWSPASKLSEPSTFGNCMESSPHTHDGSLPQSPSPFPFLEAGGWSQKFQASNHGLVFLVTSHHPEAIQEPTQSHLIRTNDTPITQESLKDLGALCQEPGSKAKLEQKMLLVFTSLRRLQRFWELCARDQGPRSLCIYIYIFFLLFHDSFSLNININILFPKLFFFFSYHYKPAILKAMKKNLDIGLLYLDSTHRSCESRPGQWNPPFLALISVSKRANSKPLKGYSHPSHQSCPDKEETSGKDLVTGTWNEFPIFYPNPVSRTNFHMPSPLEVVRLTLPFPLSDSCLWLESKA